MPGVSEMQLHSECSALRALAQCLEREGPRTQLQLSASTGLSIGFVCKSLQFLMRERYVLGANLTFNRTGSTIGKRPRLYQRTNRPLPDPKLQQPAPPTAEDLRDIMNAIILRKTTQ